MFTAARPALVQPHDLPLGRKFSGLVDWFRTSNSRMRSEPATATPTSACLAAGEPRDAIIGAEDRGEVVRRRAVRDAGPA